MIERIEHDGPTKVAEEYQLPDLTANGWRILAVVQEQITEGFYDTVPDPSPQAYQGATLQVMHYHPMTKTGYLLGQSNDDALINAIAAKKTAETRVEENAKALDEAQKALATVEAERDKITASRDTITTCYDGALEQQQTLRGKLQKMEQDIAKLRTHFGEKAMKEALDAEG